MRYLFFILILLITFQCTKTDDKAVFLGQWYSLNSILTEFEYTKDSIFVKSDINTKQAWNIDAKTLYLNNILYYNNRKARKQSMQFDYFFSQNKDTLFLEKNTDSVEKKLTLIRIKNRFNYLQKKLDFIINLPTTDKSLTSANANNIDLFIGLVNNKITIKSNELVTVDLLRYCIRERKYYEDELPTKEFNNWGCNLIADKHISNVQIDSITNLLTRIDVNHVYKVFKNDSIVYKNDLKWQVLPRYRQHNKHGYR